MFEDRKKYYLTLFLCMALISIVIGLISADAYAYSTAEIQDIIISVLTAGGVQFDDGTIAHEIASAIYSSLSGTYAASWLHQSMWINGTYDLHGVPRGVCEAIYVRFGELYGWGGSAGSGGGSPDYELDGVVDVISASVSDSVRYRIDNSVPVFSLSPSSRPSSLLDYYKTTSSVIPVYQACASFPASSLSPPYYHKALSYSVCGLPLDFYTVRSSFRGTSYTGAYCCILNDDSTQYIYHGIGALSDVNFDNSWVFYEPYFRSGDDGLYLPFLYGSSYLYIRIALSTSQYNLLSGITSPSPYPSTSSSYSISSNHWTGSIQSSFPAWFSRGVSYGDDLFLPLLTDVSGSWIYSASNAQLRAQGMTSSANLAFVMSCSSYYRQDGEIVITDPEEPDYTDPISELGDDATLTDYIKAFFTGFWGGLSSSFNEALSTIHSFFEEIRTFFEQIVAFCEAFLAGLLSYQTVFDMQEDYYDDLMDPDSELYELGLYQEQSAFENALIYCFVPTDDFMTTNFDTIKSSLESRLSIDSFDRLMESFANVNAGNISDIVAVIPLTGQSVTIVDWSWFDEHRATFDNWVKGFLFVFLVLYNFNFVYKIVRGGSLASGSGHSASPSFGGAKT